MAWNTLVFSVGETLGAAKMNDLVENIDLVRISHLGPTPPTSPPPGTEWWDSANPEILKKKVWSGFTWAELSYCELDSGEAGPAAAGAPWGSYPAVRRDGGRTDYVGQPGTPRNMLQNGDFSYWLRGNSLSVSAFRGISADRWIFELSGAGRAQVLRSNLVPAQSPSLYSFQITVQSATPTLAGGQAMGIFQAIEGSTLGKARHGKPANTANPTRASFWIWSNVTGRLSFTVTGASGTIRHVSPFDITQASSWQFVEIGLLACRSGNWVRDHHVGAFVGLTFAAHSLYLTQSHSAWAFGAGDFRIASGQLNGLGGVGTVFRIADFQYEIGETCTPFEVLPQALNDLLISRYYQKSFEDDVVPATGYHTISGNAGLRGAYRTVADDRGFPTSPLVFRPDMRTPPTMTWYSVMSGMVSRFYNATQNRFGPTATSSGYATRAGTFPTINVGSIGDAGDMMFVHWTADAEFLNWD